MDILREVMDASTHAMFLTDAHGIVTHINTLALRDRAAALIKPDGCPPAIL